MSIARSGDCWWRGWVGQRAGVSCERDVSDGGEGTPLLICVIYRQCGLNTEDCDSKYDDGGLQRGVWEGMKLAVRSAV